MSRIEREDWLKMGQNERVDWWDHPSFIMHVPAMVMGVFVALTVIVLQFIPLPVDVPLTVRVGVLAGGVVLGLLLVLYEYLRWKNIYYVVTNSKIWHTYGIISTNRNPIRYDRVVNVRVTQTLVERFISFFRSGENIGEVEIMTADDEGGDILLENVPRIELVSQLIEDGMTGEADPVHAARGGSAARIEGFTQGGQGTRQEEPDRPPADGRRQPRGQQRGGGQQRGRGQQRGGGQQRGRGQQANQPRGGGQNGGRGDRFPDSQPSGRPRDASETERRNPPPEDADGRYPDERGGEDGRYPDERGEDDGRYPDDPDDGTR